MKYGAIMADPPWAVAMLGKWKRSEHHAAVALPYGVMTVEEIKHLPVAGLAAPGAHLWLWTTNAYLRAAFDVLEAWGARYLTTITWRKPSGFGAYFATTTQHCLFGYFGRLKLRTRWERTDFEFVPRGHSRKPDHAYRLVERVSFGPYLELFARERRLGWDSKGDAIDGRDLTLEGIG